MKQERIVETSLEVQSESRVTIPSSSVDGDSWEPGQKATVTVEDGGWWDAFTVSIPEGKWRFRIPTRIAERREVTKGDYVDVTVEQPTLAESAHNGL